jgi:hypothetical protein
MEGVDAKWIYNPFSMILLYSVSYPYLKNMKYLTLFRSVKNKENDNDLI